MWSIIYYNKNIIKLLLNYNVDLTIKDENNLNAIDYAYSKSNKPCEYCACEYQNVMTDILELLYDKLIEQKLSEQKLKLYEEIYCPDAIGYKAAKNRFTNNTCLKK